MEAIRYVVVVHGIGEQRQNETVISVVSRCAEARRELSKTESYDVLTLGMACSQTGKAGANATAPWLEFRGIPQNPSPSPGSKAWQELQAPFLGEQSRSGENLRFVDLHWADLLQADIKDVGQSPEVWSDGLLGRLKRKNEQLEPAAGDTQRGGWLTRRLASFRTPPPADPRRAPSWAIEILRILKETITLLRRFTTVRARELDETIFTKFLGDVQLYGEYSYCRGQAVRRFHELIARVEEAHEKEEERREAAATARGESYARRQARYTIVAHSLGSIMSFDALLYAHANPAVRAGIAADISGLPFPGHLREKERDGRFRFLDTSWVERVDSFVTLGSPIDKFLVLWWLNYKHLLVPRQWMDPALLDLRHRRKIRFFNYSDEQDPVGHHLDVAATAPAVAEVFKIEEDKVYNRFAVPGLAHNSYWKDLPLFKRILHLAVDGGDVKDEGTPGVRWFDPGIYQKGLTYAYYVIPYAVLALHFFTFTWALYSKSWHGRTIASVLFFVTFLLGRRLIDLSLWWRQVVKTKKSKDLLSSTQREKNRAAARFRWRLCLLAALYLGLAGISFGALFAFWGESVLSSRLIFILGISGLSLVVWWLLFLGNQAAWRRKSGAEGSEIPEEDLNKGALPLLVLTGLLLALAWLGGFWLAPQIPSLREIPGALAEIVASVMPVFAERIKARTGEIALNLFSLFSLAAAVFTYTALRFYQIRWMVRGKHAQQNPDYVQYAGEVKAAAPAPDPQTGRPATPIPDPTPSA